MRYAIVDASDAVVNVIEMEKGAQYEPPKGCKLVEGRDWPPTPVVDVKPPVRTKSERIAAMLQGNGLTVADLKAELAK
jgi:hypothetical protein